MKFSQFAYFSLAVLVANAAGIPEQIHYANSTLETVDFGAQSANAIITAGDISTLNGKNQEDETRDKVVVVMKDIVEGVLDAFNDFGDAAGIGMDALLEDSGYELEVSTKKRSNRNDLEKRTLLVIPVALKLMKAVLGGVSALTGAVCGKCYARPELAFAANAAVAINAVL